MLIKLQEVFISLIQTWEERLGRLQFYPAGRANDHTSYSFIVFQNALTCLLNSASLLFVYAKVNF